MEDVYVFDTKDEIEDGVPDSLAEFRFSVKKEFLAKVKHPEKKTPHELFEKHEMQKYLHSTNGPAAILLVAAANKEKKRPRMATNLIARDNNIPGYESGTMPFGEFWINGKRVSPEEESEMLRRWTFTDKFETTLDKMAESGELDTVDVKTG